MSRILIFGSTSGLGCCLIDNLRTIGHSIIPISSNEINFNYNDSFFQIHEIIEKTQPEVIINCAGVLGDNNKDFKTVLSSATPLNTKFEDLTVQMDFGFYLKNISERLSLTGICLFITSVMR